MPWTSSWCTERKENNKNKKKNNNNNNKKRSKNNKSPNVVWETGKGDQSHIFGDSKGVGVTIESYGKLEISYINVDNF
jgi:hypothetical protein